ncbi:MAG TPA: hypothetical protein GXZ25_11440, partial [Peptococcaceae bacterium]|nr:hypothetical protein [Peptococcaceae bacterium]
MADKLYRAEIDVIVNEDLAESRISKFQKNFERRVAAMNRIKISPAATIQDRVTSSAKKIEASLNRMNRIKVNPTVSIQDRISSSLQRVESNINRLTRSSHKIVLEGVDRVTNVAKRIISTVTSPLALIGGGAGVAAAIGFPLKLAGEMDRARRSIEFYSDSVEEGRENFERFVNYAIKSPIYELPFVVQTAGQLLATGQT